MNPPWWVQTLTRTLGANPRLAGCRAIPTPCPRCGTWTITGYDAPACATLAACDPQLASTADETRAVLTGVATYRLWGFAGLWSLTPRHLPGVRPTGTTQPADAVPVLIAHRCGQPPIAWGNRLPVIRPRATETNDPPF